MSGLEAEAFSAIYETFLQESFGGTIEFKDNNTYLFSIADNIEDIIDPRDSRPLLCDFVEMSQDILKTQLGPSSMPYLP